MRTCMTPCVSLCMRSCPSTHGSCAYSCVCILACAGFQLLDVRLTNSTGTSIIRSQGGAPANRTVTDGTLAVWAGDT